MPTGDGVRLHRIPFPRTFSGQMKCHLGSHIETLLQAGEHAAALLADGRALVEAEAAIQVRSGVLELTERVVDAGPLQVGILERGAAGRVRLEGAIEGLHGWLQLSVTGVDQAEAD